jgi:ribonuclease HI
MLRGPVLSVLFEKMQLILNKISEWANKYDLEFCQKKTNFIVFTTVKHDTNYPHLYLEGNRVKEVDHNEGLKYLGVTLDKKLSFKMHIDNKIVETKQKLGYAKQRIWAIHGTSCLWLKYAYDAVAVPTFTYAAHIWAHKLTKKHKLEMININRMACKLIAPQVGRSPTDGLEVILGIQPLDITLEAAAVNKFLNIEGTYDKAWGGTNKEGKKVGFIQEMNKLINIYYPRRLESDKINQIKLEKGFAIEQCDVADIIVYTDGSKMEDKLGFGVHIKGEIEIDYCGKLRDESTVFMAECIAIKKAVEILAEHEVKEKVISFRSDSQSTITALNSHIFKSDTVFKTRQVLDDLGGKNMIFMQWVKAHVGEEGNEYADELAKQGQTADNEYEESINVPISFRKNTIKDKARNRWEKRWRQSEGRHQTKAWMEEIDLKKSDQILRLSRTKVALFTQFITGFNFLGRHVHKEHPNISQFCRACKDSIVEDATHLTRECPRFLMQSRLIMNKYHEDGSWTVKNLNEFLSIPGITTLLLNRGA